MSGRSSLLGVKVGDRPDFVRVYGGDHSPWVQAVLLGLHEAGIDHQLESFPPLSVFAKSGVLMPAASIDGGPWMLRSNEILETLGYGPITDRDRKALFSAWRGVQHRVDSVWRFWHAWSLCRDGDPRWLPRAKNYFLRGFVTLYFTTVLKSSGRQFTQPQSDAPWEQFSDWERRLESAGPFLGGESPDSVDFSLFGIIQCHASVPVPPLETLRETDQLPRLKQWISRMQGRFADYEHLYTAQYFRPERPALKRSGFLGRALFWLGSLTVLAAFPLTIPLVFFYVNRVRRQRLAV